LTADRLRAREAQPSEADIDGARMPNVTHPGERRRRRAEQAHQGGKRSKEKSGSGGQRRTRWRSGRVFLSGQFARRSLRAPARTGAVPTLDTYHSRGGRFHRLPKSQLVSR